MSNLKESWEREKAADKCSNSLAPHTHSLLQLSALGPQQEVSHPGRVFGHKITDFACPCLPCCWKHHAGVAQCPHPSLCRRYASPDRLPGEHAQTHRHNETLQLEIQTKIWLSTPKGKLIYKGHLCRGRVMRYSPLGGNCCRSSAELHSRP